MGPADAEEGGAGEGDGEREEQRVKSRAPEGGGRAAGARVTVMETRGWSGEIKDAAVRSGPAARDSCLPGRDGSPSRTRNLF